MPTRVALKFVLLLGVVSLFADMTYEGARSLGGMALWGVGMEAQESIMRAAIAGMVPPAGRGGAYGVFNGGYGVCWFFGSAILGILYDTSMVSLIVFSMAAQLASVPVLLLVRKKPVG